MKYPKLLTKISFALIIGKGKLFTFLSGRFPIVIPTETKHELAIAAAHLEGRWLSFQDLLSYRYGSTRNPKSLRLVLHNFASCLPDDIFDKSVITKEDARHILYLLGDFSPSHIYINKDSHHEI